MKGKFKLIGFAVFILAISLMINSASATVTKDGITVTLLENTDHCDNVCFSKYEICYPGINLNQDLDIKFNRPGQLDIEPTEYLERYEIELGETPTCRKLSIHGKKGTFENIDNIPCILGTCFDEFAWWNTTFEKARVVTNASASIFPLGYEIKFTFGNGNIPYADFTDNFNDMRITDGSNPNIDPGTEMAHFRSDRCVRTNTSQACDVYINSTSANQTSFIIWYGNATPVADVSNGKNVFRMYDDFNDNSINATIWLENDGSGRIAETNSRIQVTDVLDGWVAWLNTQVNFTQPIIVELDYQRVKPAGNGDYGWAIAIFSDAPFGFADPDYANLGISDTAGGQQSIWEDGVQVHSGGSVHATGQFYHYETRLNSTGVEWFQDFTLIFTSVTAPSGTAKPITVAQWNDGSHYYDNFWIRTLVDDPPTWSIGSQQNVSLSTSLFHGDFELPEIIIDSATYVPIANFTFNSSAIQNLTFAGAMNLVKQTIPISSDVSIRLSLNGFVLLDEVVRTVSGTNDIGVATLPFSERFTAIGENILLVEAKEDGLGSVNISNFNIHANCELTTAGLNVDFKLENISFIYSGNSFASRDHFDINKTIASQTIIDVSHRFSATDTVTPSCFLGSATNTTPLYARFMSGVGDIGSSGMNYFDSATTTNTRFDFICSSDDAGETITNNASVYWFGNFDSGSNTINSLQDSNNNLNITAGNNNIISGSTTVLDGDSVSVMVTTIIKSSSGSQTPSVSLTLNNGSTTTNTGYLRFLSSDTDIATVKFYGDIPNLTVGDTVTYQLNITVPTGETLDVLNASLTLYETTELNVSAGDIAPIPGSITNPANNSQVFGETENVSWDAFTEPNGQMVSYNISLYNKDGSFNVTLGDTATLSIPVNYSTVEIGAYDLVVEGCDPGFLCANSTINITVIPIPSCNVTFNTIDSINGTDLTNVDVNCTGTQAVNITGNSPFSNVFLFGSYQCAITRTNYTSATNNFSCTGTDFDINNTLTLVVPEISLNITLTLDIADLPLVEVVCINNVTLRKRYNTTTTTLDGSETTARVDFEHCTYGCDFFNNRCRTDPVTSSIIFACFLFAMIIMMIVPALIITANFLRRKRTLKFIVDIAIVFATVVIDVAFISIFIPGMITYLGSEFVALVIIFNLALGVYMFVLVMLFINNIRNGRYSG